MIAKVESKIKAICQRHPDIQCYMLALLIHSEFGGAIVYNGEHVMVRFDLGMARTSVYADKKGVRSLPEYEGKKYYMMPKHGIRTAYGNEEQMLLIDAMIKTPYVPG